MPGKKTKGPEVPVEDTAAQAGTPEGRARAAFDAYRQRMREPGEAEAGSGAPPSPWPQAPATPQWGFPFGPAAGQPPGFGGGFSPRMEAGAAAAPGSTMKNLGTLLGLSVELINVLLQGGTQLLYGMSGQDHGPSGGMHPTWGRPQQGPGSPHGCCQPCEHCLYRECGCGCHPGVHGCR